MVWFDHVCDGFYV